MTFGNEGAEAVEEQPATRSGLRAVCPDCRSVQPVENRLCSECRTDLHHNRPGIKYVPPKEAQSQPTKGPRTQAAPIPVVGVSMPLALGVVGFTGVIVGSFLPWAEAVFITVNGMDRDGVVTLVIGAVGLVLLLAGRTRASMMLALVAAGGAGLIGVHGATDVASLIDGPLGLGVRVGSGLYLIIVSSVVAGVSALWRANELSSR